MLFRSQAVPGCLSLRMMHVLLCVLGLSSLYLSGVTAWTVPSKQGPNFGIINCDHVHSSVKRFCLQQLQKRSGITGMSPSGPYWMDELSARDGILDDIRNERGLESDWDSHPEYPMPSWLDRASATQEPHAPPSTSELLDVWRLLSKVENVLADRLDADKDLDFSRIRRDADAKQSPEEP